MFLLRKILYLLYSWFNPRFVLWRVARILQRLRGVDFLQEVKPEDVGLDSAIAYKSSPSGNRYLVRVLKDIGITEADAILDVGCGKGSAMNVMRRFPFRKVDGMEISSHIASIAQANFSRLRVQQCGVYNCDAETFSHYGDYNMFYFYNPFPAEIMKNVISGIIRSIPPAKNEITIIYNNPTCHDTLLDTGCFWWHGTYPDKWGHGIRVYSNYPMERSRLLHAKKMTVHCCGNDRRYA